MDRVSWETFERRWRGRRLAVSLAASLALASGCGDDDGGPVDAHVDAPADATVDAGAPDAPDDAGSDAGTGGALACEDAIDDVYVTPADLPAWDDSQRGAVVRCGEGPGLTAARSQELLTLNGYTGPALAEDALERRILFRTPRANGEPAVSSAVMYYPTETPAAPVPLIVVGHPTTGLTDFCTPSQQDYADRNMQDTVRSLLPLVGTGHVVIQPDYIGLGTDGMHGFLSVQEAAKTILDAARAAFAAAPEGLLSGEVFLLGHSQGGHAVLAAQTMQREYAPELDVRGVTALAPPWFDITAIGMLLGAPSEPVDGRVNFATMYTVGHQAILRGDDRAWNVVHPDLRAQVQAAYESQCHFGMIEKLQTIASRVEQLYNPTWRSSVASCLVFGLCDAVGETWRDILRGHTPPLDPEGAPVWFHLGTADDTMNIDTMACVVRNLRSSGIDLGLCGWQDVTHGDMSLVPYQWLQDWIAALREGGSGVAPTCDESPVPPCGGGTDADAGAPDAGASDAGASDAGV